MVRIRVLDISLYRAVAQKLRDRHLLLVFLAYHLLYVAAVKQAAEEQSPVRLMIFGGKNYVLD